MGAAAHDAAEAPRPEHVAEVVAREQPVAVDGARVPSGGSRGLEGLEQRLGEGGDGGPAIAVARSMPRAITASTAGGRAGRTADGGEVAPAITCCASAIGSGASKAACR